MGEFNTPSRVGIFVDYENIWRSMGRRETFLQPILALAKSIGRVVVGKIYVPLTAAPDLRTKSRSDYELVVVSGHAKANWLDINMIVDMMDEATACDITTVILVSGDGDFEPAVRCLKKRGRQVVVVAGKTSTSRRLRTCADTYLPAEQIVGYKRKLEVAERSRELFGHTPKLAVRPTAL